jgi:transposase-like protein
VRRIDVDAEEIVRLYASGLRASAIATRLGCRTELVYARLAEAGVPRTRKARAVLLGRDEISRLYLEERWSLARLAARYDVAPQTIARHLREWGVPTRSHVEALQPAGRRRCPRSLALRSYLLGFVWGDLAVEETSSRSLTVSVRGSTTHDEQVELINGLFAPYGAVSWSVGSVSSCVRVSLDRSFSFLFEKYGDAVPTWIRGHEAEAAFAAGYVDAEGSFGVYAGRARFKLDSYDEAVVGWMADWMRRSGIECRHRLVAPKGSPRSDAGSFNGDLWRINVNEALGILRLSATLEPFLRHERRRARMAAAVANVHDRLRSRAFP